MGTKKAFGVVGTIVLALCPSALEIREFLQSEGIAMSFDFGFYWNVGLAIALGVAVYILIDKYDKGKSAKNDFADIVSLLNIYDSNKIPDNFGVLHKAIIDFRRKHFPKQPEKDLRFRIGGTNTGNAEKQTPKGLMGMSKIQQLQLEPEVYASTKYKIPRSGWFEFSASSLIPFNSCILDEKGMKDFKNGKDEIYSYGGFTNQKEHHQKIELAGNENYYLVFYNKDDEPIVVFWEVY